MAESFRGKGFQEDKYPAVPKGRTKLLVFGINKYKHCSYWNDLGYPVNDCKDLIGTLKNRYGLKQEDILGEIYNENATHAVIAGEIGRLNDTDELGNRIVDSEDNLIIVFSGHGCSINLEKADVGFWVMHDSKKPASKKENPDRTSLEKEFISVDKLISHINKTLSRHILIIIDACYASSFATRTIDLPKTIQPRKGDKGIDNPSRWVLTSGRNEKVPDRSEFAVHLVRLLDENREAELTVNKIYEKLRKYLKGRKLPVPLCKDLVTHQWSGGDFSFFLSGQIQARKDNLKKKSPRKDIRISLRENSTNFYKRLRTKGRFSELNIEKSLLPDTHLSPMQEIWVEVAEKSSTLSQAVCALWEKNQPHGIILGDGGMGKTVSLLQLWEDFLANPSFPIPLFVALNEYNNATETGKQEFIIQYIANRYLDEPELTTKTKNRLWKLFRSREKADMPGFVLLLDGFNEVTADNRNLVIELNRVSTEADNMQILVTSRHIEIQNFTWASSSTTVSLLPLRESMVIEYLEKMESPALPPVEVMGLLRNPMMLALYVGTEITASDYKKDTRFVFLPVNTTGELLWNFNEALLAKHIKDNEGNKKEVAFVAFLFKLVLPYIAWRMEKQGQFLVSGRALDNSEFYFAKVINDACNYFKREGCPLVFPELFEEELIPFGDLSPFDNNPRARKIRKYLLQHLKVMVLEGDDLRFLHQNLRDFYAACHLRNSILISMTEDNRPLEWKERVIPVYLRKMLGEIEGEYLFDPYSLLDGAEVPGRITNNLISKLLDACRGKDMDGDYTVWNLVKILSETRGNLAGANLGNIDLRNCKLKDLVFNIYRGSKYLAANIESTRINGHQFSNYEITGIIRNVKISPDGKYILVASSLTFGYELKELSLFEGKLIRQFKVNQNNSDILDSFFIGLRYNTKGNKILSWDGKGQIREWEGCKSEPNFLVEADTDKILDVDYKIEEKSIISSSINGLIKEWNLSTGICTFETSIPENASIMISKDGTSVYLFKHFNVKILNIIDLSIQELNFTHYNKHGLKQFLRCFFSTNKEIIVLISKKFIIEYSVTRNIIISKTINPVKYKYEIAYNDKNNSLLFYSKKDGSFKIYSLYYKKIFFILKVNEKFDDIQYSSDGKIIIGYTKESITILSILSGSQIAKYKIDTNQATSANYREDGKTILVSNFNGSFNEYSVRYNLCLKKTLEHQDSINSIVYGEKNDYAITGSSDSLIMIWDLIKGRSLMELCGHTGKILRIILAKKTKRIYSISIDSHIGVWCTLNNKLVDFYKFNNVSPNMTPAPNTISLTSDCEMLLIGTDLGNIYIISENKKTIILKRSPSILRQRIFNIQYDPNETFLSHLGPVTSIDISKDNKRVLSSSWDEKITEWDLHNQKSIFTYSGHTSFVMYSCYSNDEKRIISISDKGVIKIWCRETKECIFTDDIFPSDTDAQFIFACYSKDSDKLLVIFTSWPVIEILVSECKISNFYYSSSGIFVNGLDFRKVHESSNFTDLEKETLRHYGAIFTDEDEKIWKEALADAYGEDENN